MDESLTYLLINIGSLSIPFLFSFHPKLRFDRTWNAFFPACLGIGFFFIIWDIAFTSLGVWGFTPRYLTGIYVFNLPLEEYLFFLCIPYACLFTYHCLNILIKKDLLAPISEKISLFLIILLTSVAILNFNKSYTVITFIMTAVSLYYFGILKKYKFLSRFYLSYFAILPFFFLTNGILTGSFIDEPVVWYNDNENLGIRIGTIPVEDSIYGFLLLFWNVVIYEYLMKQKKPN